MERRHRFVSTAGYGVLVALALVAAETDARAQISPGPLSRPHRNLDTSSDCLDCHQPQSGVSRTKCLSCHVLLAERIESRAGLHANPEYADCATCHMDHSGRDFELIWWGDGGQESFDHGLAGYVLAGAHEEVDCRQCHQPANIAQPERLRVRDKDLGRTFLGLGTACASCHADEHRGQFEELACTSCHTTSAWVPASQFEHATTGFALAGAHERLACSSCHSETRSSPVASGVRNTPRSAVYRLYSGGSVDGCAGAGCHVDQHARQFGNATCLSCHNDISWTPASRYDHDRARYRLTGQHRRVECAKCHDGTLGTTPAGQPIIKYRGLEFGQCAPCHLDNHEGRLGPLCSTCHATEEWGQSTATFDHDLTRYPLRGKHTGLECETCHTPGEPRRVERFDRCNDCHTDAHYGQLSEEAAAAGCERCHAVDGFRPSAFVVDDHARTRYPLDGSHLGVDCEKCHQPVAVATLAAQNLLRVGREVLARDRAVTTVQLRFGALDCASCHDDPHAGQVDRIVAATGCETCHVNDRWSGVSFDHTSTAFPLVGVHASTGCVKCHPRVEGDLPNAETSARLRFTGIATECRSCHDDQHRGQFDAPKPSTGCVQCHTAAAWKPSSFDHKRDSQFRLEGAHERAACDACHPRQGAGPDSFVRYRPLPNDCQDCHGAALSRGASWL